MNQPMLVADGLRKSFGDLEAVHDLSFSVDQGETFGLLGPNGAGKTTTISMLCGLLDPDAGTVHVGGERIRPGSTTGRARIGYVPQEIALYLDLSGHQNLAFFARLYGLKGTAAKARIDEVLDIVGLTDRAGDRVEHYSGGMQRRLNIAAGLLHRPDLLILDEPTVGIDPQSRNMILEAVASLGRDGMSVLYTTHYMEEAERLCARVGIVDHGRLLACGSRRELVQLIDGQDQVLLSVTGDAAAVAARLQEDKVVTSAQATSTKEIACVTNDASSKLSTIIASVTASGASVSDLRVLEPTLDAVFLAITGTALRD